VWLNVQKGGGAKLNIAVPAFTVLSGADPAGVGRSLADVTGKDLTFTGLFSVVAGTSALPANNPDALRRAFSDFAAAGAHAALHGLVTLHEDRVEGEMRLYDLTSPEQRPIAQKKFGVRAAQLRRLAHKIADEVMLQFTGVLGAADTKIAFAKARPGRSGKEIYMVDYDGAGLTPLTENGSINLSPAWSPDGRLLATGLQRGGRKGFGALVFSLVGQKWKRQELRGHDDLVLCVDETLGCGPADFGGRDAGCGRSAADGQRRRRRR
jgi:TolB protein